MTSTADDLSPIIRQVSTREVYRNRWLSVREDEIERPDGSRGLYSVVDRADFAIVIPAEDDGFHLVDQYRYPLGGRYWEFPQGTVTDGTAASPAEVAAIELAEETGLRARRLRRLGEVFAWQGASGQRGTVFLATELTHGSPSREPEEQDMRNRWFSRTEFETMIRDGVLMDDSTLAAYTLLLLHER